MCGYDRARRLSMANTLGRYVSSPACTGPGRPHANFILPSLIEDKPLYRVRISFNRPVIEVQTLSSETEISWSANDIVLQVTDIHETVMVKVVG